MSGMQRGKRAANCANRHCFHLSLYRSVSVSALEDGLISSAPGLRFKHLSATPLLFLSTSSVSQPVSPRESPLLLASITGMMRGAVEDCRRLQDWEALGWMDRQTGCVPSCISIPQTSRTGESPSPFFSFQSLVSKLFH